MAGVPGATSAAIWPGATQPSAVLVIELAKPTTVRVGLPGALVTCTVFPSTMPPLPVVAGSSTTWPGPSTQCPAFSTRSSTGPPGAGPPGQLSCPQGWPWKLTWTVVFANGPAKAVTPAR